MAGKKLYGTIIGSTIYPSDTAQTFATHDSDYGKGGYRAVNTIEDRDSISYSRRSVGMEVRVLTGDDAGLYILESFEGDKLNGVTAQFWKKEENSPGGGELSKEIQINGGPLANEASEVFPEGTIPVGTSLEEILRKLICKELWPTISTTRAFLAPKITGSPEITGDFSPLMAVDSVISFKTSAKPTSTTNFSGSHRNNSISRMTYGYYDSLGDDKIFTNESTISKSWKNIKHVDTDKYKLEITSSEGFDGYSQTSNSDVDSSKSILSITSAKVKLGGNSMTIKETGIRLIGDIDEIQPVYYLSNLNNADESHKTEELPGYTNKISEIYPTASIDVNVTGVYPCFVNINENSYTEFPETQLSLSEGNTFELTIPTEVGASYRFMFAYPSDRELSLSILTDKTNMTYSPYQGAFSIIEDPRGLIYNEIKYSVWSFGGGKTGGGDIKITLNKNLNE